MSRQAAARRCHAVVPQHAPLPALPPALPPALCCRLPCPAACRTARRSCHAARPACPAAALLPTAACPPSPLAGAHLEQVEGPHKQAPGERGAPRLAHWTQLLELLLVQRVPAVVVLHVPVVACRGGGGARAARVRRDRACACCAAAGAAPPSPWCLQSSVPKPHKTTSHPLQQLHELSSFALKRSSLSSAARSR